MTFKLIHLIAKADDFSGVPDQDDKNKDLRIVEEKPNLTLLLDLIEKVGGDSNWHNRTVYHDQEYLTDLKDRIEKTSSHLWLFQEGNETIGFCQTIEKQGLTGEFNTASGSVSEVYKIGLFPEHVGKGKGNFLVASVLHELFKENDVVYLNTRDTNKVNSIPFYERLGLHVVGEEEKPGDYIQEP